MLVQNRIKNELRRRAGKMAANTEYRPMYQTDEDGASLEDISLSDYELEYNRTSFLEEYNPELVMEKMEQKKLHRRDIGRSPGKTTDLYPLMAGGIYDQ